MLSASWEWLWPALVSLAHLLGAAAVTVDAVLRKREVSTVIGWIGLAWLVPVMGSFAYLCFGINRIQRSAAARGLKLIWSEDAATQAQRPHVLKAEQLGLAFPSMVGLARLGDKVADLPLLAGNRVSLLEDGDNAYPAMLAAIDAAQKSVAMQSYIFDHDEAGQAFLQALLRAHQRGVAVRVLIDDIGARYSRPNMLRAMRRAGLRVASFLPTRVPRLFRYANLRNHRKILVVDGTLGFTGGMNIRVGHWRNRARKNPVRCLHCQVEGPMVADLQRAFLIDWAFSTGENLGGPAWLPTLEPHGNLIGRGVPDGPDIDIDNTLELLFGALSVARERVSIVTPYFLPDMGLQRALQVTAMRGVQVDIVLPRKSNIWVMNYAQMEQMGGLLDKGCRVYFSPEPFDHSKMLVVDGLWSLLGSTNWDSRSLRLNFEFNIECYDAVLAADVQARVDQRIAVAEPLSLVQWRQRSLLVRLRDGLARLGSPYL